MFSVILQCFLLAELIILSRSISPVPGPITINIDKFKTFAIKIVKLLVFFVEKAEKNAAKMYLFSLILSYPVSLDRGYTRYSELISNKFIVVWLIKKKT